MDLIQKKAHEDLHKKIYDCNCKPHLNPWIYCNKCQGAIIDFMNKYGAGILTRDIELEELEKSNDKICKENRSVKEKLDSKIKRVEVLKEGLGRCSKTLNDIGVDVFKIIDWGECHGNGQLISRQQVKNIIDSHKK